MKILVTGGAGYIGSHACKALAEAGHTPITYDNMLHGHEWAVKWGPLEIGDINDTPRLRDVMTRHKMDAVMHFAALISVEESVADPELYYCNNVAGTESLLNAMKSCGVHDIVFSSSAAVYGNPESSPVAEVAPLSPVSPYGYNKVDCEHLLKEHEKDGLRWISLRYFNAAGADKGAGIGSAHTPATHLLAIVLDTALGLRPNVQIFGQDYPTHDGSCIRDYIHVSDLAQGHLAALAVLQSGIANKAINLGTGKGVSVKDMIEKARIVTRRPIPALPATRRPGDPAALVSDNRLAKELLGWTPHSSEPEQIIEDAWRWHQSYFGK